MSRPKKKEPEHVTFDRDAILCLHCGKREVVFPAQISGKRGKAWTLNIEAFAEEHARCKETDASPTRTKPADVLAWLDSFRAGTSSMTIVEALLPEHATDVRARRTLPGVPLDPADFGRCHDLLELFPALRPRLGEVAKKYPEWRPLVGAWEQMTALYLEEFPTGKAPKLYALMKKLLGEGESRVAR